MNQKMESTLNELIGLEDLKKIQDSFAATVNISSIIFSPDGEPLTQFSNPTNFCLLIQSTEEGKKRFSDCFKMMSKEALLSKKTMIQYYIISGGYFVAPIVINNEHKGTMFAGQFIPKKFSKNELEILQKIAQEIEVDPESILEEAKKMRVIEEEAVRRYSNLFFQMVNIIAKIGSQAEEMKRMSNDIQERTGQLQETNNMLTRTMDALWGEMEVAKKIQTILLPSNPEISGYSIAGLMQPSDDVGGDYYDIINTNGKEWIIIGDVSGHGISAGLVMMMVQTSIHTVLACKPDLEPSELLTVVNDVVTRNIEKLGENKYMTLTVLGLIEDGKCRFSGLHQDILIYRAATEQVDVVETVGMWVGITKTQEGMFSDNTLCLEPGDTLLLFSDGIVESVKKESIESNSGSLESKMYGQDKLIDIFQSVGYQSPEEIKDTLFKSMDDFVYLDDLTMLIIKRDNS